MGGSNQPLDGPYQPGNVTVSMVVPIRTISRVNAEEHPMARARRVRRERDAVLLFWGQRAATVPCTVYLTRIAPARAKVLDDDNRPVAVKALRDELARLLGVDDGDARVKWAYPPQEAGAWGVRLTVVSPSGGQVLPQLPRPAPPKKARAAGPRMLSRAQAAAGFRVVPNFIAPRKP